MPNRNTRMSKSKSRKVVFKIEAKELERIVHNELGGITIEAIVTHANIKITAFTSEYEKVKLVK
jgi:hypothetical protein